MSKFMLLIYGDPAAGPADGSPEQEAEMGAWFAYTDELAQSGQLVAGDALFPTATAKSVRVRDGEELVTDGPFAETKEVLGGYYIVDVPDEATALEWAKKMPNIAYGTVEVRPLVVFDREGAAA